MVGKVPDTPNPEAEARQYESPNFVDKGRLFLVRCFVCDPAHGRENYGPAVATGTCVWCGWKAKTD